MNTLVFDIETIPDLDAGRRLYGLDGLDDDNTAKVMFHKRREETGESEFLRHPLHRVIVISAVFRKDDQLHVWSLGDAQTREKDILQRFFEGIEKYTPTLVSWNGGGFDLPVLHYRALLHGINAQHYWDQGEHNRDFKFNNYLSRYHTRHIDLMDVLSGYQQRAACPLDMMATLLGLPGKLGMSGADVWPQYQAGHYQDIRDYCETDVLNTWLVYLHFERMRGHLDEIGYATEVSRLRDYLRSEDRPHFRAFLDAWK